MRRAASGQGYSPWGGNACKDSNNPVIDQVSSKEILGKVNLYIDGFNLYFGLRAFGSKYKWLDLIKVGEQLCRPDQDLGKVQYFTARIKGADASKIKRQTTYLEAIERRGVHIVYGKYQRKRRTCKVCGKKYYDYEEKESDVNLGTTLLLNAATGSADTYLVVSGDSDLILPMQKARDVYKRDVVPVFPPKRHSKEISGRMGKYIPMSEALLRKCQLPDEIINLDGYKLVRPPRWDKTDLP